MSKYNAKKVEYEGIKFDSLIEKKYYIYLKQLKQDGKIKDFSLQPEFTLQPKFEKDGIKYQPIKYKADFKVINNDGSEDIVDIKGFVNAVFKLKEKMFHYHFKEKLKLLTYSELDGGWVTLDQLEQGRKKRKVIREKNKKVKELEQKQREAKFMKGDDLKVVESLSSGIKMTARTKKSFLKYIKENYSDLDELKVADESLISKAYLKKIKTVKELLNNNT